MLPDDVALRLRYEARRRGVPVAEVVRKAVDDHLQRAAGTLSFIAVGEGSVDGSERVDEVVWETVRERRDS